MPPSFHCRFASVDFFQENSNRASMAAAAAPRGKVTIFGIGRLGLCTALCLDRAGYDVVGVDVFPSYVKAINDRSFHSTEPRVMEFLKEARYLKATTDLDEGINHSDVYLIFVATPSTGGERHYDHSMLGKVLMDIVRIAPCY